MMDGVLHSERVSQIMANGSLEWFPPNRMATFPKIHNLKGIPQEKSYLFVCQWLNLEPPYLFTKRKEKPRFPVQVIFICLPMVEFGTSLSFCKKKRKTKVSCASVEDDIQEMFCWAKNINIFMVPDRMEYTADQQGIGWMKDILPRDRDKSATKCSLLL